MLLIDFIELPIFFAIFIGVLSPLFINLYIFLYFSSFGSLFSSALFLFSFISSSLYSRKSKLSIISFVLVIKLAPFFISRFVPIPYLSLKSCGIVNTLLFCDFAIFAVTLVPLLCFASITSIPIDKPLTMRFLSMNFSELASVYGGYSLTINPLFLIICLYNFSFF